MIKKLAILVLSCLNFTVFACPNALPRNDPSFCASFKEAATCYCALSGFPAKMCQDMRVIHKRMMVVFGSLQKACEYQHYTSVQDCMDNWNCYLSGGVDSEGRSCSATQYAC